MNHTERKARAVEREASILIEQDKPWFKERLPMQDQRVHAKLKDLSDRSGNSERLAGTFSGADILMVTVLRRLERFDLLNSYQNLLDYIVRKEERPAYRRAYAAQLKVYTDVASETDMLAELYVAINRNDIKER